MKTCLGFMLTAAALLFPASASADWFVFPFAAVNTGGETTKETARNVFEERFAQLAYWRIGGGVTGRW